MPDPPRRSARFAAAQQAPPPQETNPTTRIPVRRNEVQTDQASPEAHPGRQVPAPEGDQSNADTSHSSQTPLFKSTSASRVPSGTPNRFKELRRRAGQELEGHVSVVTEKWITVEYSMLIKDASITQFLRKGGRGALYNTRTKRWIGLPEGATDEKQLYRPLKRILTSIIRELGGIPGSGLILVEGVKVLRDPVIRDANRMAHLESDPEADHYTMPDIVIRASGPSFEVPSPGHLNSVGYTNIAAFVEVKLTLAAASASIPELLEQNGVYARQVFIQQPNRMFVRCLVVTKDDCILFHFDRSGAQHTLPFNIHQKPSLFVRAVLGITSQDEKLLGLDTAIQWTIGPNGRKQTGTVTVSPSKNKKVVYELFDVDPEVRRYSIRGRGTTCWRAIPRGLPAKDETQVIIKQSWRSATRTAEYVHLKKLKGVPGIGQMVTHGYDRESTTRFRGSTKDETIALSTNFGDRALTSIVLVGYGGCILSFKTELQFLSAIRDALSGHMALGGDLKLAHRDVTPQNILLPPTGQKNVEKGFRGFLVDFDLAVEEERDAENVCTDPRSANFKYMSMSLLERIHGTSKNQPDTRYFKQGRLDDLESAWYVTFEVVQTYRANGKKRKEIDYSVRDELERWESNDIATCAFAKKSHFSSSEPSFDDYISPCWSPFTVDAILAFYKVVYDIVQEKGKIGRLTNADRVKSMKSLYDRAGEYYERVRDALDEGIRNLEREAQGISKDDEGPDDRENDVVKDFIIDNEGDEYEEDAYEALDVIPEEEDEAPEDDEEFNEELDEENDAKQVEDDEEENRGDGEDEGVPGHGGTASPEEGAMTQPTIPFAGMGVMISNRPPVTPARRAITRTIISATSTGTPNDVLPTAVLPQANRDAEYTPGALLNAVGKRFIDSDDSEEDADETPIRVDKRRRTEDEL